MDLLDSFARAAREAQAEVVVATTYDDARRRVTEILRAEDARFVMVSPDAATQPWSCGDDLPTAGLRVVTRSAAHNDREELLATDAGVTVAAYGLADTGTLVLCASPGDHRLDSLLPPVHVALVRASTLLPDLATAFARFSADDRFARHSADTFVRGPSRTADIEMTLTIGVHGPGKLYIVLLDDSTFSS